MTFATIVNPRRVALLIAFAWLAFALASLSGFGLTSDSPSLFYAGDRHLFWLFHPGTPGSLNFLGPDPASFHSAFFRFPEMADPLHYPVFPGFVAAVTSAIFHDGLGWLGAIDAHHLGLVLFQAVNLFLFATFAMSLFGVAAGASASVAVAFFPCIIGHAINNAKDLPCIMLYGCALMIGARGLLRDRARDLLWCGVFAGLGLSCKLNAAFAIATLVLWTVLVYPLRLRRAPASARLLALFWGVSFGGPALVALIGKSLSTPVLGTACALLLLGPVAIDVLTQHSALSWRTVGAYSAIPFIAAITFVALWPWLWAGQALTFVQRLGMYADGMIRFSVSPRAAFTDYPVRCLIFTTPPLLLGLALVGFFTAWRRSREQLLLASLAALWLLLPLARIALPHSMFYDANRHFIEYVPALCVWIGLGFAALLAALQRLPKQRKALATGVLVASSALALIVPIATYHPYEVTYFNWLAGGLGGAQRDALLFVPGEDWRSPGTEGDYWHGSLRDFLSHVGPIVPPTAVLGICGTMYDHARANWNGPPLKYVDPHEGGEYMYLSPRESFCGWAHIRDLESQRPVLLRVMRDGGLIYEIVGPRTAYPLPPLSPRTVYDPPLVAG